MTYSHLLQKSKENETAAVYLTSMDLFAPAAHCGYYSCIQKVVYVLQNFFESEFKAEMKFLKGGYGNRHKSYIDLISALLPTSSKRDKRDLKNALTELRTYRLIADYENEKVTESHANLVNTKVKRVHTIIKRHTNI